MGFPRPNAHPMLVAKFNETANTLKDFWVVTTLVVCPITRLNPVLFPVKKYKVRILYFRLT